MYVEAKEIQQVDLNGVNHNLDIKIINIEEINFSSIIKGGII